MTNEQIILRDLAMRGNDGPFLTNDPEVNHSVDCQVLDSAIPYSQSLYEAEIEAWKESGGLLLGWCSNGA